MPSPIPRCSSAVLLSLASHRDGGLRLFRISSAFTLLFSRLARRSLILWPARSLIAFSATFFTEGFARGSCPLRTLRLLPAGATVAGWVILLPLELRALFTAHAKLSVNAAAWRSPCDRLVEQFVPRSEIGRILRTAEL